MKACCMILIPRHVTLLLGIVCSCHVLILYNLASMKSNMAAINTPLSETAPDARATGLENDDKTLHGTMVGKFGGKPTWNLSSANEEILPWAILSKNIGRQLNSDSFRAAKEPNKGFSFKRGSNKDLLGISRESGVRVLMDSTPLQGGSKNQSVIKAKGRKPLVYSDAALREFYQANNSIQHANRDLPNEFKYLINPSVICTELVDNGSRFELIVLVHSHPDNKPQRNAVRDTWGRHIKNYDPSSKVKLVFVLGAGLEISLQQRIVQEGKIYRDILQGDFIDMYETLSMKSLFGINWVSKYCQSAKFLLKADDDSYIHMPFFYDWLQTSSPAVSVIGSTNTNADVMRTGLWHVPVTSFPFNKYPTYCTGCAYVIRTSLLREILEKSFQVPLIPIEDAYITGILITLIGHTCHNVPLFPQWHLGPSKSNVCKMIRHELFGIHNVSFDRMYTVHGNVSHGSKGACLVKRQQKTLFVDEADLTG